MERAVRYRWFVCLGLLVAIATTGCRSPHRADQGALFGGLVGAGTGALIGDAAGNAGAGAAIGAGIGALTGAAVGSELDEIEAQNRAMIEQQMGRQVAAGAVTLDDVIAMSSSGVDESLIVTHVQKNGMAQTLSANDLIFLQQQNVPTTVIHAMQQASTQPVQQVQPVVIAERPSPVVVKEYHYGPHFVAPCRPHRHYHWRHRRPGVSWGVSVSN